MPQSVHALTLGTVAVRQHDGLFSLNDLHRASGGELRHRPVEFMRLDLAQGLLCELQKGGDPHLFLKTVKGRNGGTYACRELVIAYAAWISAAFHLRVIRVFLDASAAPAPAAPAALPGARPQPGFVFLNPEEQRIIELLRFTTYAGRDVVQATAEAMRRQRPWVDGDMPHNTARLPAPQAAHWRKALGHRPG